MVHIGTSSLSSKASKIRKKNAKSGGKDSKVAPETLRESLPRISTGEQARLASRSSDPVNPWAKRLSTGVAEKSEDCQMRGADGGKLPQHPKKGVPESAKRPSLEEKGSQCDKNVLESAAQNRDADADFPEEGQQPFQAVQEHKWKQTLVESQDSQRQLLVKVQQLEHQLVQQSQRCIELDRAWKKSTALLTQLQGQDPHDKVDDSTLQGLYSGLVFDVSNWSASFCRGRSMRIVDTKRPMLHSLSPAYAVYIHDEKLRPFLLQSLLMRLLVKEVLNFDSDGGLWWAGGLCKPLRQIYTELMPFELLEDPESNQLSQLAEIRDYARWKANGALLIGKRAERQVVNTGIDRVVSKFKQDLYLYVPASKDEVWTELREIVAKAVMLDEEMNKSRALLTVSDWGEEDFKWMQFDEACMESAVGFAAARPGMSVELVLAPALVKTGTADAKALAFLFLLSTALALPNVTIKALPAGCVSYPGYNANTHSAGPWAFSLVDSDNPALEGFGDNTAFSVSNSPETGPVMERGFLTIYHRNTVGTPLQCMEKALYVYTEPTLNSKGVPVGEDWTPLVLSPFPHNASLVYLADGQQPSLYEHYVQGKKQGDVFVGGYNTTTWGVQWSKEGEGSMKGPYFHLRLLPEGQGLKVNETKTFLKIQL
ncbi:uncharacterized protein K460DRAFT_412158 [Cucurbitaria berberidis CBS 394.84]|uniref:Uncharacterized protein n=1 Tax=Cucurbitaria berberidis CBS 394.84 TaxID=1168544 RepID=A0A9P4GRK4_9PLEO|nr:uncharacterized protein K460DRAFT_412158 [Cucurbitaria berberidis CBS 394.84]KAF1850455.1 hypothetical protein K460DRAFT_412158 [Cucurbitaria berberidis CBS 394.84]